MNKGTLPLHTNQADRGEIRFSIDSPGKEWVKLDGSALTPKSSLYSLLNGIPQSWTTQTSNFGTSTIFGVAYANSLWVAVGAGGTIRTSTDAITWTTQTSNTTNSLTAIAYNVNGGWLAGGSSGTLRTSTDGVTWTTQTSQFGASNIQAVAYGNNLWVAVGDGGVIRTSTDAITWTTRTSNTTNSFLSIAYGNNIFVAGATFGVIRTSTDGITWNTQTSYLISDGGGIGGIAYGNNIFSLIYNTSFSTSTDGITWSNIGVFSSNVQDIVYGNGIFLGMDVGGGIVTSTTGITWVSSAAISSTALYCGGYGNGIWVVAGLNGILKTSGNTLPSVNLGNNIYGWIRA